MIKDKGCQRLRKIFKNLKFEEMNDWYFFYMILRNFHKQRLYKKQKNIAERPQKFVKISKSIRLIKLL